MGSGSPREGADISTILIGSVALACLVTFPSLVQAQDTQATLGQAERLSKHVLDLYNNGRYEPAIPLARQALELRELALGPDHVAVASSLNDLGDLLRMTGNYDGARPLYERGLRIQEEALGSDHPEVARTLNNLALLLLATGDHVGSRALLERALTIDEHALGSNHPAVASDLNNLGKVLQAMGDSDAARPLLERAQRIREQPVQPSTSTSGQIFGSC